MSRAVCVHLTGWLLVRQAFPDVTCKEVEELEKLRVISRPKNPICVRNLWRSRKSNQWYFIVRFRSNIFLPVTLYHFFLWPLLRKKSYDTSQETMLQNQSPILLLHTTLQKNVTNKRHLNENKCHKQFFSFTLLMKRKFKIVIARARLF